MMDTVQVQALVQDMLDIRQKPHITVTHTATCATVNPLTHISSEREDKQDDKNNTREG